MAHTSRILAVLAVLSATVTLAASGATALAQSHPSLSMSSSHPATVHGRGFPGRARVHIVLNSNGSSQSRTVRAARDGSFAVTFTTTLSACPGWSVTATTAGRPAVRLHSPHVMCAPPGTV